MRMLWILVGVLVTVCWLAWLTGMVWIGGPFR